MLNPSYEAIEAENIALKQRVGELESRIAVLDTELSRLKGVARESVDVLVKLKSLFALTTAFLLAAVPPLLVVQDRWLGHQAVADFFREPWEKLKPLSQLAFPPYFAVVFVCLLALAALFILLRDEQPVALTVEMSGNLSHIASAKIGPVQKRISYALLLFAGVGFIGIVWAGILYRRMPGWDLVLVSLTFGLGWLARETRIEEAGNLWRQNQEWLVAALLLHVTLVAFLASYYSPHGITWVFALLLALAAINALRNYRSVPPIYWVTTLALVLFTLNINGWWFSVVGDEYSFYRYARDIAETQSVWQIGSNLFNGQAVYGTHPYFSSFLQAISVKLFGSENFGWRFSNIYPSAMAIGLLFAFFQAFVRRWVALVAALFLAASHYLMSFGKIGYNNLQAFLALALTLWAAAWAVRTRRPLAFVTLGFTLAFCFYVYPAALYALPLPIILLLFYFPPTSRAALGRWGITTLSMAILLFPLSLQPVYWQTKVAGTIFYNPKIVQTAGNIVYHLVSNTLYSLFSFMYVPDETHFVAVSYVDPLTATLVLIGAAYLLTRVRKERFVTFFLSSFVVLFFLVGVSHDRTFPTPTRMFMLLPWFALFAASGLAWVVAQIRQLGFPRLARGVVALVVIAVVGLNLYQAYPLSQQRMAGRYQSMEVLFLRLAERVLRAQDEPPKKFVWVNNPNTFHVDALRELLRVYAVPFTSSQLVEIVATDQNLSTAARSLVADRSALVIISPRLPGTWQASFGRALGEMGKVPCDIRNMKGDVRFTLWRASDLPPLCEQ